MTQPQTPAPRPVAADLDAALYLADAFAAISVGFGHPTLESHNAAGAAATIRQLAADLDATRAERDAALAKNGLLWQALPSPDGLSTACACMAVNNPVRRDLELRAARIRALDPAPVPAADVPDVPAFLAHRVNGGAM